MRLIPVLLAAVCASVISAYIIAAPVYAVRRNIDGKPRAMRAREEQLRRRLLSRSRAQKVVQDETVGVGKYGGIDGDILDICEVSDCELPEDSIAAEHFGSPEDGEDDDDDDDDGFYAYDSVFQLPAWDVNQLAQITEITLGTPPQRIRVIISISDSDLFVPSSQCGGGFCKDRLKYNSSLSTSHEGNGTSVHGGFTRLDFSWGAIISRDTLHIAGVEVEGQSFIEGTSIFYYPQPEELLSGEGWDGYLGLAPSKNGSFAGVSNAFQNIASSGLLDRNIFSLKLSRGPDDPGELMFGGINHDLYVGELKEIQAVRDSEELWRLKGRWIVPLTGISIGDGSIKYDNFVATLESDFPLIGLPREEVMLLMKYLGMESKNGGYIWSIDCAKRDELEDFTITLGGHDFVIGPYEYTLEIYLEDYSAVRCVSAFAGTSDQIPGGKYAILGSAFLRKFYSVFDPEAGTVSLGKAALPEGKQKI